MEKSITHILDQCALNNEKAYKALVEMMSPTLMTTACRYVNYEDAQDILQDSYMSLFTIIQKKSLKKGKEISYIHRIVINNCLKKIRNKRIDFNFTESYVTNDIETPNILDQFATATILKLIEKLPTACKLCFQLYEVDGFSHKEIGEKLNISESTSRANLSRAKKLLQNEISINNKVENLI